MASRVTPFEKRCDEIATMLDMDTTERETLRATGKFYHTPASLQAEANKFYTGPLFPTLTLKEWDLRTMTEEEFQDLLDAVTPPPPENTE